MSPQSEAVDLSFAGTSFEDVVLQNSSEFYRWLSELEAARASETEVKYQRHAAVLESHLKACDDLLATIDEVFALFDALKEGQRAVSSRTSALHVTCERLVAEQEALMQAVDAIRSKLTYFDELDAVAAQFHASSLSLEDADILSALQRLDECLAFLANHPHYADAATFSAKFKQLQGRALAAVRSKVQASLRAASQAVQRAAPKPASSQPQAANATTASDSSAETTLLYVRFRAAAEPSLKKLFEGIEARADSSTEYARLLRDCQALHCDTRLGLVRGMVTAQLRSHAGQPLPVVLRSGCAFLLHIAQLETQLFEQMFPASAAAHGAAAALGPLMDPLCTLLYDALRPALVSTRDVDELCDLAFILKEEGLADGPSGKGSAMQQNGSGRRAAASALLDPVLGRLLADVQERLAYRALAFIREGVAGFSPAPGDLNYPACLQNSFESGEAEGAPLIEGLEGSQPGAAPQEQYVGWYPPVQRALLLLSKLYRTVPPKAFSGLAQEAVTAAAAAVQEGARGVTKASGPLHGQLFAAKQLLLLREGISPLEADFAVVERDLDFSHLRDHLKRTLSGQVPLFSFSSSNAVMQLVSRGPRLSESQLDAKRDLERQLKVACESLIMAITKIAVDPAVGFLTKVTAVRVSGAGPDAKPIREQAFAAPDRVAEVVAGVNAALEGPLQESITALKLYLPAEGTQAALLRPIKANVTEAHEQLAALIEAEYLPEQAAAIGLVSREKLATLLEGM